MSVLAPRFLLTSALLSAILLSAATTLAQESPADGVYGRFRGDLSLAASAGVELGSLPVSAQGELHAMYLSTAAIFLDLGGPTYEKSTLEVLGIEVRPLFLPRWGYALERGPAWLDLVLDSLAFRVGARWEGAHTPALELGLHAELPLLGRQQGPFLALGGLRILSQQGLAGAGSTPGVDGWSFTVALGWRLSFETHLVDFGDPRSP